MDEEIILENQKPEIQDKEVTDQVQDPFQVILDNDKTQGASNEAATPGTSDEIIVSTESGDMPISLAMYEEQIKTNFFLSLILTVTVVFFVINKFWSFCRKLFTVDI